MERFLQDGQKVKVVAPDEERGAEWSAQFQGKSGIVVRRRMGDSGAWVQMDETVPDGWRSFGAGDRRQDHLLLYPHECETA